LSISAAQAACFFIKPKSNAHQMMCDRVGDGQMLREIAHAVLSRPLPAAQAISLPTLASAGRICDRFSP
jgi:hypothetical protein